MTSTNARKLFSDAMVAAVVLACLVPAAARQAVAVRQGQPEGLQYDSPGQRPGQGDRIMFGEP